MSEASVDNIPPHELEAFQRHAEEYASCENEIKRLNVQVKELRSRQKELKPDITVFMRSQELDRADVQAGTIKYSQSKSVKPMNRDNMVTWIADFYHEPVCDSKTFKEASPEAKAESVVNHVFNIRDHTVRERISSVAHK